MHSGMRGVRRLAALFCGLATLWPVAPAWSADAADAAPQPAAWLQRLHDAATQKNYQGTLVVSASGAVSSARVAHFCDGPQQYERIESLDGPLRHVYRHNGTVHTVWPESKVVVIEQRDMSSALPSLLRARPDPRLFDHYVFRFKGAERIAGLDAEVVLLEPRDAYRFAQKFWAERRSGLLLRADMIDADGRVIESAAFSEVAIGVKPNLEAVLGPMRKLGGYRVVRPELVPVDLDREGWTISDIPGFRAVSAVRRAADDNGGPARTGMVQAVFSDGLTHVSVFIELYQPGRHQPGRSAVGATHTLMQQRDQWWVTVMGDVPSATLAKFAGALQRRR